MLKVLGKIDLSKVGKSGEFYAKYLPVYYDLGCSCHYAGTCGELYSLRDTIVGYIKVDQNGNFLDEVGTDRESFINVTDGTIQKVNFDRLREQDFIYNRELFTKYPKPNQ